MRTIKDTDPERFAAEAACRSAFHQNFKNHLRRSQTNDAVRRRPIEIDPRWPYARAIVVNANKTVQRQLLIGFAAFSSVRYRFAQKPALSRTSKRGKLLPSTQQTVCAQHVA